MRYGTLLELIKARHLIGKFDGREVEEYGFGNMS